ncbi:MAG: NADH-quinone oxidoreductase subunit N [bacterium]|nr:NADH-quinone oxidoreductase subunit N [bacterium]
MPIELPPYPNLVAIAPEIVVLVTALAVLIIDFVWPKWSKGGLAFLSAVGLVIAGILSYRLLGQDVATQIPGFAVDAYAQFFKVLFCTAGVLVMGISVRYLELEKYHYGEYYFIILIAIVGQMIMASGTSLMIIYVGLELMALSLYILAGLFKRNLKSNEASVKYFLLGSFSSALFLYGIVMTYGLSGSLELSVIAGQLKGGEMTGLALLAVIMMAVGFAFKVSAAPFHFWSPDVYEGSPTSVTAFMSVGPKAAAFAALLRVFTMAFGPIRMEWEILFIVLAIVTMVTGNFIALRQTSVKRMLAYSSIAHAGYLLIGVVVGGETGISSVLLYLLVYTFMNVGAFGVLILLNKVGMAGDRYDDFSGLAKVSPASAFVMMVFMFSLAGIPPTAGFAGKFYIFMGAVQGGYTWLAIIGVLNSAVSAYYYLRVIVRMYMETPAEEPALNVSIPLSAILFAGVVAVFAIGLFPEFFINLAVSSVGAIL